MTQLGHDIPGPGTLVSDSLATNLLTGATLNAAGTDAADAVAVYRPGDVAFVLTTSTVTGTSPTLSVVITGSDTSDFSDDVVTLATITSTGAGEDSKEYIACADVYKKYVKATVTCGGTNPVYTGSTLYIQQPHYHRSADSTAGTII
jgi:hypothetical protein